MAQTDPSPSSSTAREKVLVSASQLFYAQGVRAVGMDAIVEHSQIAKTTIYRHFRTKDDLVKAFLEREDGEFWSQWDALLFDLDRPEDRLIALCDWIERRVERDGYRGCPQINAAAEFADKSHPARVVARTHKTEMHRRLSVICADLGLDDADTVAVQISLLFDGAFSSDGRLATVTGNGVIGGAVRKLIRPA